MKNNIVSWAEEAEKEYAATNEGNALMCYSHMLSQLATRLRDLGLDGDQLDQQAFALMEIGNSK